MNASIDPTQAFELGPPDGPPCLFLHGFTGSPGEMRPLAERISSHGYHIVTPRLPGHGRNTPDLATAGADNWLESAGSALRRLAAPTHIVALSMGSLLAVRLAAEHPDSVRSLSLLAPAVRVRGFARIPAWILWRLPWIHRRWPSVPWPAESDIQDAEMRSARLANKNPRLSLFGIAELRRLQSEVLGDARRVQSPTLVVLGQRDRTISNRAARRLARALTAEVIVMPHSAHQVGLDRDREAVADAVLAHLRRN